MPAYSYANIDYPFGFYTNAQAINDIGQIAGFFYYEDGGFAHGFLYSGGTYTTIDDPLAVGSTTAPVDINASGQIIGRYSDSSYVTNGFLYSGGIYTTIDDPFSPALFRRASTTPARSPGCTTTVAMSRTASSTAEALTPLSTIHSPLRLSQRASTPQVRSRGNTGSVVKPTASSTAAALTPPSTIP